MTRHRVEQPAIDSFQCPTCLVQAGQRCRTIRGDRLASATHTTRDMPLWEAYRLGEAAAIGERACRGAA